MLIDSHCHLNSIDLAEFNGDINEVLRIAAEHDVTHFLSVCVEESDIPYLKKIADEHQNIYISVGVHPNILMPAEPDANMYIEWSQHPRCIAIGETGLDYYRSESMAEQANQRYRFSAHIEAAKKTGKPLIIHTRQAAEDTIRVMKAEQAQNIGGVMHCFSESWEIAQQALDLNFYISLSGIVTFKNATVLHELAQKVPLNRLLIETDSPYLAPVPFRGKQNHPALVKYVAQTIAALRGCDYETIAEHSTQNFYNCFRVNAPS